MLSSFDDYLKIVENKKLKEVLARMEINKYSKMIKIYIKLYEIILEERRTKYDML
jgi:hypothetical protein